MSDPVSSMDVEDVLSSIRRLVSEEAKGNGLTTESASDIASEDLHEAAEEAANGPLSDIVQAVEDGSDDIGGDGGSGGSAYGSVTPPSNEIIDDSGVSMDAGDAVADGQVAFRRHKARGAERKETDQKLVLTAAFRVEEKTDAPADMGASLDEAGDDAPEETRAYPHLRPVEDAADGSGGGSGGGSAGSGADILRQLAGAPDDTLFDRARQAMEAVRESAPVRQPVAEPPVEPEAAEAIEPAMTAEVSPLRREVAEVTPEAAEAEDAAVEPDAVEPLNASSPASPFNAEGGAFAQPVDAAQDAEASTINFAEEDPSMLDEDSLRDLVSDMVREELQGELGDRITRNVRKLVRREIQRALASREFE
jgi:cell pole-organizing protein PopZ